MIFSFLMGRRDPQHGGPSLLAWKSAAPASGTALSVSHALRTKSTPSVLGPQWLQIVQPARVSRSSRKMALPSRQTARTASSAGSGQVVPGDEGALARRCPRGHAGGRTHTGAAPSRKAPRYFRPTPILPPRTSMQGLRCRQVRPQRRQRRAAAALVEVVQPLDDESWPPRAGVSSSMAFWMAAPLLSRLRPLRRLDDHQPHARGEVARIHRDTRPAPRARRGRRSGSRRTSRR